MDINNDGYRDIISGSWPGEIFLFRGRADGSFAAPEIIKDKDGKIINIGGGIREESRSMAFLDGMNNMMLIAGNAKFEYTPEGIFVNYHGQRFESTPERPIGITGTASAAHVTDWDGDGDYDLIIGDIRGKVFLVPNAGTPESYAFGKEKQIQVGGKPIDVERSAGPFTADWDGDSDLDLLVGADDGSVRLFRNTGSARSPELASAVQLVPPGESATGAQSPKDVRRGTRSKICVADWNGDGWLDLLVGDRASQKPDLADPTPEQEAEYDRIRKELEPLRKRYGELAEKLHGPSRARTEEELERIQKEMEEIRQRQENLRARLPREYETHGWVWLFLRTRAD
ncbi:MAG: VCBS repeat-containing protein [Phycisphaerales bacterium]|nr:MAG: VCBS repeat-containing protein [Phycisphaerales bacterium]